MLTRTPYRFIEGAETVKLLSTIVDKKHLTEALIRPLTKLKTADEQVQCFVEAQKQATHEGKPVAARHVARVVRNIPPKPQASTRDYELFRAS
jgi:hypothetical protein